MAATRPQRAPITSPAAATVFSTVLTQGPVSRVEVGRRTGLSSAAVTKAARPFIEAGYLEELTSEERTGPGAGRPANPLAIKADREFFLGVKITDDDLIGVVCDLRAQVRVARHHPLTSTAVPDVVAALTSLVADLITPYRDRAHCLGVAVSGDVDQTTGVVRYSPFLRWHDVPLGDLLAEATGLAVRLENDVKALTVAEQWFGEGVGVTSFALVTVGTGIGCGLVIGGRLVTGAHGVAGELGHVPVGDDQPCHCGGTGCVEAIASTSAIVARAGMPMAEAVARARSGDPAVRAVFAEAGHAIGLALAAMANLVGPERIVVSGEGVAAYDLFEEHVRKAFTAQAFGAVADCLLILRPLPFEEWARGAAAVSIQALFRH
ncbi:ROK family protein [Umezawaea endophytica]|uniref:ROK family protein n=1 Tax=Umezawaea endophytica TaxID=1654476 RepID=A0A9X2VSP6_9PSEU|nr:ROK family protein [Umezawaea endophytica]MCS7481522.1 ROK family protein [Umezawaea endophytica]